MKFRTALLAAIASIGLMTAAQADPITPGSQISFSDGARYNSTSITFLNGGVANISANVATGAFSPFAAGCIGCATFTSFTFSPFTPPVQVYTATLNGATTTFNLTALTVTNVSPTFLDVEGTGTVTLTGYDPTPGTFLLSSQGGQNVNVTFSATTIASATSVPEPASIALLGAGLAGIGALRRRRKA